MPYANTVHKAVVRLCEAVTSAPQEAALITDSEFEDCDVYGPAVVGVLNGVVIEYCSFDAVPDILFIEAEDRPYVGIIGIQDVRFHGCRFHNVGILGPAELLERFKRGLNQPESG